MTAFARIDKAVGALALVTAMAGGATLLAIVCLTVVSVVGRALVGLGLGPVPGDYELISLGAAFAVTASLPWCQYRRGHVTVDIAMRLAGPRANGWAEVAGNVLMTLAATLIAWRMAVGMLDKLGTSAYRETTFILAIPVWWGYAAALTAAVVFAIVSAFTVARSLREGPAGGAR